MKIFLAFIFSILTLNASIKEVCITNFQKELCGDFKVLDKIIIKSSLNKEELSKKLKKEISLLAYLKDTNLYTLLSINPVNESKILEKLDFIIYAQPDIKQKRVLSQKKYAEDLYKLELEKLWKKNKGKGVKIAVIDDGFDMEHEDLLETNVIFSYDVSQKNFSSSPKSEFDTHGTQVVGIIFASHNGIGVDGIAPQASLIAIRQAYNISSETILAFTIAQLAKADIVNCSWNSPVLLEPIYDVVSHHAKTTPIVFAAGNNGLELTKNKTESSIEEAITVGTNKSYSNYGKKVDIQTYTDVKTTKINGKYGLFSGTSASAPIITGLLALYISDGMSSEEALKAIKKSNFNTNLEKEE